MSTDNKSVFDDSFILGTGQAPGMAQYGVPAEHDADILTGIIIPRNLGDLQPRALGNIHRDTVKSRADKYTEAHNIERAESLTTWIGTENSFEANDFQENPDSGNSNDNLSTQKQASDCKCASTGKQCRCLKDGNLKQNNDYFWNINRRVKEQGAKIQEYPVVYISGVDIDMELIFKQFWNYKQDPLELAEKGNINW